jgi:short subunit fatty acids transporter
MDALKKAIPTGIGSGILSWVLFSLFELLIDKKPMNETLFSTFNLIFLVIISLVEIYVYYRKFSKSEKKDK